jgi:porphobilinogen deaminase
MLTPKHRNSIINTVEVNPNDPGTKEKIEVLQQAIQQKKLIQELGKVGLWSKELEQKVMNENNLDNIPVF